MSSPISEHDKALLRGPGRWRKAARGETSRNAALKVHAPNQREAVLAVIAGADKPITPEQITAVLANSDRPILLMSCRPRCSELAELGLIRDSGLRGKGEGGMPVIAYEIVPEGERQEPQVKTGQRPPELLPAYREARRLLRSGTRPLDLLANFIATMTQAGLYDGEVAK